MKEVGATLIVIVFWSLSFVAPANALAASSEPTPKRYSSTGILCTPKIRVSTFGGVEFDQVAAHRNTPLGLFKMGYRYYYGDEVKRDYKLAVQMLQKGAARGNAEATYLLAAAYIEGKGAEVNRAKAEVLLKKAAGLGCPEASVMLGNIAKLDEDYDLALKYFQKASEKGSLLGKANEAYAYIFGQGVKKDNEKAAQILAEIDSVQHDHFSQSDGVAYGMSSEAYRLEFMEGEGGGELVAGMKKAASAGNRFAQNQMALVHLEGLYGLDVDLRQTYFWAKKAACQFNPYSMTFVGDAYARGVAVERDEVMALKWYRSSVLDWNPDPDREFIGMVQARVEPLQNGPAREAVHNEFTHMFIKSDMEQFIFEQCH